jgi:hypothetical protein
MNLISLSLAAALATAQPGVTIVSYRIAAPPNSIVRYAGATYNTGATGTIELIADPLSPTVSLGDTTFNLPQSGPTDAFGSVTVSLQPENVGTKFELKKGARTRAAR